MAKTTTLADRIRARLAATGKSASAVSLEAGLSRSAIRDILNGKAGSPRFDTLVKLASPLGCTVAYLTGHEDDPADARGAGLEQALGLNMMPVALTLKVGVYADEPDDSGDQQLFPIATRTTGGRLLLCRIGDDSLTGVGVLRGDLMLTEVTAPEVDPLSPGVILVVERALNGLPNGPYEYSARVVNVKRGAVSLDTAPRLDDPRSLVIDARSIGDEQSLPDARLLLRPEGAGSVRILGVGIQVVRELPRRPQ